MKKHTLNGYYKVIFIDGRRRLVDRHVYCNFGEVDIFCQLDNEIGDELANSFVIDFEFTEWIKIDTKRHVIKYKFLRGVK